MMTHFGTAAFPAKPALVRRTLLEAAIVVRSRGLAKFQREDQQHRVCLHGAIGIAACGNADALEHNSLYARAVRVVCRILQERGVSSIEPMAAARWNNRPERTVEEVAALLEAAARRVKVPTAGRVVS